MPDCSKIQTAGDEADHSIIDVPSMVNPWRLIFFRFSADGTASKATFGNDTSGFLRLLPALSRKCLAVSSISVRVVPIQYTMDKVYLTGLTNIIVRIHFQRSLVMLVADSRFPFIQATSPMP